MKKSKNRFSLSFSSKKESYFLVEDIAYQISNISGYEYSHLSHLREIRLFRDTLFSPMTNGMKLVRVKEGEQRGRVENYLSMPSNSRALVGERGLYLPAIPSRFSEEYPLQKEIERSIYAVTQAETLPGNSLSFPIFHQSEIVRFYIDKGN
jgi:hypothetical protein